MIDRRTIKVGSAVRIYRGPDGTPEWAEARRRGIGGSDIASILRTEGAYKTPYEIWCDKTGRGKDQPANRLLEAGHYAEIAMQHWYRDHLLDGKYLAVQPGTFRSQTRPWQIANPDALVVEPHHQLSSASRILEFKFVPNTSDKWHAGGGDITTGNTRPDIPEKYWQQCQWYMHVLDIPVTDIVAMGGFGIHCWRITAHREWQEDAARQAADFWSTVEADLDVHWEPEPANYEADRRRHPHITDATVTPTADTVTAWREYQRYHASFLTTQKTDTTARQGLQARMAHEMGDAGTLALPDGTVLATRTAKRNADGTPGTPFVSIRK